MPWIGQSYGYGNRVTYLKGSIVGLFILLIGKTRTHGMTNRKNENENDKDKEKEIDFPYVSKIHPNGQPERKKTVFDDFPFSEMVDFT